MEDEATDAAFDALQTGASPSQAAMAAREAMEDKRADLEVEAIEQMEVEHEKDVEAAEEEANATAEVDAAADAMEAEVDAAEYVLEEEQVRGL